MKTTEAQMPALGDPTAATAWFRTLVDSAPCAMLLADREGVIAFANSQAERLFGYQQGDLVGRQVEQLIPTRHRPTHSGLRRHFFAHAKDGKSMGVGRDLVCLCRNGREVPVEIGLTPIQTPNGKMVLSTIIDISERKRLEQKLAERNREISQAQALAVVGRMANMVAHDLRNPLSSVKMTLQIFGKQTTGQWGEEDRELQQIALDQVRYMEGILADMLSYSRDVTLKPNWLHVEGLLDAATLLARRHIDECGARVYKHYQPDLPMVHGDADKLRQVFSNILINAVQATQEISGRQPEIGITTRLDLGAERPRVCVEIRDNGCGLEAEPEGKFFEPFFTTRAKGTGLGLAIVKRIVERHQGSVALHSAGKTGACAVVTLSTDPLPDESSSAGTPPMPFC